MPDVIRFVDAITTGRTTRLDLNDGTTWKLTYDGTSFTPPAIARAMTGTMLSDGERVPASKYSNRLLRLQLVVTAASADAVATEVQKLQRELDRQYNVLEWKPSAATNPVFFRTFRSSPDDVREQPGSTGKTKHLSVELMAESFAYGLAETATGSPFTVNHDPAAGSNPMYFDVTGVKGDVPAATKIDIGAALIGGSGFMAVRRRGTPSNVEFLHQAEGMTQGTDTTTQPNDATYSGAGNNFSRCTFATATMQTRLSKYIPAAQNVDTRGTYRVLVRYKRSSATGVINLRLKTGPGGSGALNATISTVATELTTGFRFADMGLIQVPYGIDPVYDGPSLSELVVDDSSVQIAIQAERTSGTSTIDFDYVLLLPADDAMLVVDSVADSLGAVTFDSYTDMAYATLNAGTEADSAADIVALGGMIELAPNQTNRIFAVFGSSVAGSETISVTYYPRYLYVRPAAT